MGSPTARNHFPPAPGLPVPMMPVVATAAGEGMRHARNRDPGEGRRRSSLVTAAAVFTALCLVGTGAWAAWTSSAAQSNTMSSGTLTVTLGATGASTNRLNVNASGLTPGTTVNRSVNVINSGSTNFSTLTLTTTATASSTLDTDATNGLQMVVKRCSVAWTESGSSPNFSYTCGGSQTTVISSRAVIGSSLSLGSSPALTSGATDYLQVQLTLPSGTTDVTQGQSSTIQYSFNAA